MATGLLPDGGGRSSTSILDLDKSTEPWSVQIAKAAKILGIDLGVGGSADPSHGRETKEQSSVVPCARVDWTVKWLLKNLQPAGDQPSAQCQEYKSWVLLQRLAIRTPKTTLARLLSAHKFVKILESVFRWLREDRAKELLQHSSDDGLKTDGEGSSSDTVLHSKSTPSKKRKRGDVETGQLSAKSRFTDSATLYSTVCSTVRQFMCLTISIRREPEDYAVEHMKHALKPSLDEASVILGSSFFVANRMMEDSKQGIYQSFEGRAFDCCVLPVIDLCNLHSSSTRKTTVQQRYEAYMHHCCVPNLQLLRTCQDLSSTQDNMADMIVSLKKSLIDNVILPTRASLHDNISMNAEPVASAQSLCGDLASVLSGYPLTSQRKGDWWGTQKHLTVTLVSLLFEVAINCFPRSTQKLRKAEDPWLEGLFNQLSRCVVEALPSKSSSKPHKYQVKLLEWMLSKAVDNQVQFSASTIERILSESSGLCEDVEEKDVEWRLIRLCLRSNANVFVIPSSPQQEHIKYSYRTPNKYLRSLVTKLTKGGQDDREFKVQSIVIPLLETFVDARDLLGFIGHWTQQVSISRQQYKSKPSLSVDVHLSIWEDEDLLQSAAQFVESALTGNQVQEMLQDISIHLASTQADDTETLPGNILLLDCVTSGLTREGYLNQLSTIFQSIFEALARFLLNPSSLVFGYRWRLWRTMASVADRCPITHGSFSYRQKACAIISVASELINRVEHWKESNQAVNLTEELQAFGFLLRFATVEDRVWQGLQFSSREKALSATRKVLDVMEPFCRRIMSDHFAKIKCSGESQASFDLTLGVDSVEKFYFGCIAYMLGSSTTFSCLDVDLRRRFIEHAYVCALYQRRSSITPSQKHLDYIWPWQSLINSKDLEENRDMMRALRTFQVERYLTLSESEDPKYWDMRTADYSLSFDNLQRLPTKSLGREQRTRLANRVLRILLRANMHTVDDMISHLTILARLISRPNNSIAILNNSDGRDPKGDVHISESKKQIALLSIARGIDGSQRWSEKELCIDALRKVSQLVMNYLFSTLDQESSIHYLKSLYTEVNHMLKSKFKKSESYPSTASTVIELVLTSFHRHRIDALKYLPAEMSTLATARQNHLEICIRKLPEITLLTLNGFEKRYSYKSVLECMVAYADLLRIHPELAGLSKQLLHVKSLVYNSEAFDGVLSTEALAVRLAKLELLLASQDDTIYPHVVGAAYLLDLPSHEKRIDPVQLHKNELYRSLESSEERKYITHALEDAVSALTPSSKATLLDQLPDDGYRISGRLFLLRIIIHCAREQDMEEIRPRLSRAFTALCQGLSRGFDYYKSMLAMQCISMMLQSQSRIITQWHIDTLLSAITTTSSTLTSRTSDNHTATLHTGLCKLFSSILTLHRPKTGGRYHLILPALQSLLRCLFTPHTSQQTPQQPSPFSAPHATTYARLLITLCSPSVSSVTRAKKRPHTDLLLNDETKKACSIAGQHLQYLIMEYCHCRLRGRLWDPEMRTPLEQGLWAVMGVMRPEVMRTMNAAMVGKEGGREVFRGVYEDWKRFGEWKGG